MGSLRRWLKARLGLSASTATQVLPAINLLEEEPLQLEAPALLGITTEPNPKAWSVSRLMAIFRDAQRNPSASSLQAARHARHCLSAFWLGAPVDQLQGLYEGAIGDLQRLQLQGVLPRQPLAADEQRWRDGLVALVLQPEQASQKLKLLLALMPYFPPSSFAVEDPVVSLPRWLLRDYVEYCQPELKHQLDGPAGLLTPGSASASRQSSVASVQPDALPILCERRGEAALDWLLDEGVLSRQQALINLYGLDPADAETRADLAELRRVLAQLWLDIDSAQLQMLFETPIGLLTRSLHTAGFGRELLADLDRDVRRVLAAQVDDLSDAAAVKKLLALLPFCPPGSITLLASEGVPAWLLRELSDL